MGLSHRCDSLPQYLSSLDYRIDSTAHFISTFLRACLLPGLLPGRGVRHVAGSGLAVVRHPPVLHVRRDQRVGGGAFHAHGSLGELSKSSNLITASDFFWKGADFFFIFFYDSRQFSLILYFLYLLSSLQCCPFVLAPLSLQGGSRRSRRGLAHRYHVLVAYHHLERLGAS